MVHILLVEEQAQVIKQIPDNQQQEIFMEYMI